MNEKLWIDDHPMFAGWCMGVLTIVMIPLIIVLLADVGVI